MGLTSFWACFLPFPNEMVNVSYQEESWYVLLQHFDKNSALDKTYFCVTEFL